MRLLGCLFVCAFGNVVIGVVVEVFHCSLIVGWEKVVLMKCRQDICGRRVIGFWVKLINLKVIGLTRINMGDFKKNCSKNDCPDLRNEA